MQNELNITKFKEMLDTSRSTRFIIDELITNRLLQINKRVSQIRGLKTYKEGITSSFMLLDVKEYLFELKHLNDEYNTLLSLYDDGLNLLTDYEQTAIKETFKQ